MLRHLWEQFLNWRYCARHPAACAQLRQIAGSETSRQREDSLLERVRRHFEDQADNDIPLYDRQIAGTVILGLAGADTDELPASAAVAVGWRCEECDSPWPQIGRQCQRCGNRTRVPTDDVRGPLYQQQFVPDPPVVVRGPAADRDRLTAEALTGAGNRGVVFIPDELDTETPPVFPAYDANDPGYWP